MHGDVGTLPHLHRRREGLSDKLVVLAVHIQVPVHRLCAGNHNPS